jgi:hypothetical protein
MQCSGRRASLSLAAIAFLFFWSSQALAQTATGEVTGTVTDNSGGAIGGASVKLNNTATGVGPGTDKFERFVHFHKCPAGSVPAERRKPWASKLHKPDFRSR